MKHFPLYPFGWKHLPLNTCGNGGTGQIVKKRQSEDSVEDSLKSEAQLKTTKCYSPQPFGEEGTVGDPKPTEAFTVSGLAFSVHLY